MREEFSLKDYPLSGSFDEMDAFIIFDDVFIPNERLLFVVMLPCRMHSLKVQDFCTYGTSR